MIAYREDFDFEGGSGMVARGIGTAVLLESTTQMRVPLSTAYAKQPCK